MFLLEIFGENSGRLSLSKIIHFHARNSGASAVLAQGGRVFLLRRRRRRRRVKWWSSSSLTSVFQPRPNLQQNTKCALLNVQERIHLFTTS